MKPLIVVDADVLGRRRTGDETYVENLLRALPRQAPDLRIAAVTRHPELVPEGVEPVALPARFQEVRMAWSLPRLLRRVRPAVAHFQHSLPLRAPSPSVVTVHDLSFEGDRAAMGPLDRAVFRTVVPRSARAARKVLAVSERTKRDLIAAYGIPEEKIVVTPHGVDPAFAPGAADGDRDFVLFVGAVQPRKDPLAALDAARAVGLPLVVAGPVRDPALARVLAAGGARMLGYVEKRQLADLYRDAACLVLPSRFEGFGLPVIEAMASGTPVVASPDPALREVAGDAAILTNDLVNGIRRALAERERLVSAGFARARAFSWEATARITADAYREVLGR